MTKVFVYGTLKKGFGNHGILGKSEFIDEAITKERCFTMFDGVFPFVSDSFVNDELCGSVVGELYEVVDEQTMANLDRLEGVPTLYVKREVDVATLQGDTYKATMYVASRGSNKNLESGQRNKMKPNGRAKMLEWN